MQGERIRTFLDSLYLDRWEKLAYEQANAELTGMLSYCRDRKLQEALIYAHNVTGRYYHFVKRTPESLHVLEQSVLLARSENNQRALMYSLCELSTIQGHARLFSEAIKNTLEGAVLAVELQDTLILFQGESTAMSILFNSGSTDLAIDKGKEIVALHLTMPARLKTETSLPVMSTLNTIAMGYAKLNQYDSSLRYYHYAEDLAKLRKDKFWIGLINGNRALVLMKLKKYVEAAEGMLLDFRLSQQASQWGSAIQASIGIADAYQLMGKSAWAQVYLDSARYLQTRYIPRDSIAYSYWRSLADLKFTQGDYTSSHAMLKRYVDERVNAITQAEAAKIANAMGAYDLERKKNEIDILRKNEYIQHEQIRNQRIILLITLIGLLLAILLVISFVYNYRRQKRINKVIEEQRDELAQAHDQVNTAYEELRMTQDTLVRTEKLAFLGRLTAGIAHEVNSPLGAVKASSENTLVSLNVIRDNIRNVTALIPPEQTDRILDLMIHAINYQQLPSPSFAEQRAFKRECLEALDRMQVANSRTMAEYVLGVGITTSFEEWKDVLTLPHAHSVLRILNELGNIVSQTQNIGLAVNRASKIVFALKNYSRVGDNEVAKPVDVTQNLETVLVIYASSLSRIEIIRQFESVPLINGYEDELSQVWTNLIHNAIQAMKGQGILSLRIGKHNAREIRVEIIDNGPGIPAEHQEKLFRPFFTTKPAGEGTGLGLSIVERIVEKHHGRIEWESELTQGALFRIILPVND